MATNHLRVGVGEAYTDPMNPEADYFGQHYRMAKKVSDIADVPHLRDAELRARAAEQYERRRIQAWKDYYAERGMEMPDE